jgi:PilZ domain
VLEYQQSFISSCRTSGSLTTQQNNARPPDRRRNPRYPFVANAEFNEAKDDSRKEARVTEIGLNGCYLETPDPLAENAQLFLKIFKGPDFFECSATVAYSHPNRGMGLRFRDVHRQFLSVLQKWLLEAMRAPRP